MMSGATKYKALGSSSKTGREDYDNAGIELEQTRQSRNPSDISTATSLLKADDERTQPYITHYGIDSPDSPREGEPSASILRESTLARKNRRKLQGWRFGIALSSTTATLVLLTNTVLVVVASLRSALENGIGDLYSGDCDVVNNWNLGLHLLINALSSVLLGASNYAMQCCTSPTRSECDNAHARGNWLDIGVTGIHNLFNGIKWQRRVLWALLAISSIPIHLLYNSAVFKTLDANEYGVVVANPDYLNGTDFSGDWLFPNDYAFGRAVQANYTANPSVYETLSPEDCISTYGVTFLSGHANVILITNDLDPQIDRLVYYAVRVEFINNGLSTALSADTDWLCEGSRKSFTPKGCNIPKLKQSASDWPFDGRKIDHCLAEKIEPRCKLQYSVGILIAVIVCNLIKSCSLLWILFCQREDTLVTFGDAIASWLDKPDERTANRCLMTKSDVADCHTRRPASNVAHAGTAFSKSPIARWNSAVSGRRWVFTLIPCAITLIAASALLGIGMKEAKHRNIPDPMTTLGFGIVNPNALINIGLSRTGLKGLVSSVLLANLPQTILSFLYLLYNGLYTSMHLSHEYSSYAVERKPLRVSTPHGRQRTTYWLQLPYTYGVPLILASGTLHWLISQSIFLARVTVWSEGVEVEAQSVSAVGYSCAPIVCILVLGSSMLIIAVLLGRRRLRSRMPVAGSCSLALAAAAHRPEADVDAAVLPVKWGVVVEASGGGGVGHCSFTSEEVSEPQEGVLYAGYLGAQREEDDLSIPRESPRGSTFGLQGLR